MLSLEISLTNTGPGWAGQRVNYSPVMAISPVHPGLAFGGKK